VEIELQLIEPDTYNLLSCAEDILKSTAEIDKIRPEFYLSTIEINTDKCKTVQDIEKDLAATISRLKQVTQDKNILFSSTGSHPFSVYDEWNISSGERYQSLVENVRWLSKRMCVFGMHIHLGMQSGDDCIQFNNFFMHFLPHLLALSSSSPFCQGIDTGLSSSRPTTYESLPTAGHPYHVDDWQDFENLYQSLKNCNAISSMKDLWWDMRPSPGFGTLEIRVCDGIATLSETLAISAFIHALGHWFKDNKLKTNLDSQMPSWIARENKWRAMRYGLDAELVINQQGKTMPAREDIRGWLEKLQPYTKKLGYGNYIDALETIIQSGNSASRQRSVFESTGSLKKVTEHNVNEFLLQFPLTQITQK
jgi:carboxylate-amine ligase